MNTQAKQTKLDPKLKAEVDRLELLDGTKVNTLPVEEQLKHLHNFLSDELIESLRTAKMCERLLYRIRKSR